MEIKYPKGIWGDVVVSRVMTCIGMDLEGDYRELINTLSDNLPAENEKFENNNNIQVSAEIQTR